MTGSSKHRKSSKRTSVTSTKSASTASPSDDSKNESQLPKVENLEEITAPSLVNPIDFVGMTDLDLLSVSAQPHPYLTKVESKINPDLKAVPDPYTLPVREPECGVYTGPGYGKSEVSVKDVDFVEEKIVYTRRVQRVERPYEVIREVVKPIVKQVVEFRKVVDETDVVEVPKPFTVETRQYVPNFIDTQKYAVMKTLSKPNVIYDEDALEVECLNVIPDVHVIPIQVPKVVNGSIVCKKGLTRLRRLSNVTSAEWNALVLKMNPKLCEIGDLDLFPIYKNSLNQVIALKPEAI